MSDEEDNDVLSEMPSSDPFRTAEVQEVPECDKSDVRVVSLC